MYFLFVEYWYEDYIILTTDKKTSLITGQKHVWNNLIKNIFTIDRNLTIEIFFEILKKIISDFFWQLNYLEQQVASEKDLPNSGNHAYN